MSRRGRQSGVDRTLEVEFVGVVFAGFAEGDIFGAFGRDGEDDGFAGGGGVRDQNEVELGGGLFGDGDEDYLVYQGEMAVLVCFSNV